MSIDVHFDDGVFKVKIPYSLNHIMQEMPDRVWNKKESLWRVPPNWRAWAGLKPLLKFNWTPEAIKAYSELPKDGKPVEVTKPAPTRNYPFKTPPFAHQQEGLDKAYWQEAFALFFEQGLGKTKTTIDLAGLWFRDGFIKSVVIICPVSIRNVWVMEFEKHFPFEYEIQMINGSKPVIWRPDVSLRVLICGVESLSQGGGYSALVAARESLGAVLLAVDESTRVKNYKATRTDRTVSFSKTCERRLILTGTPTTQGIEDLYSQFQVLRPATLALDSYFSFRNRYCIMGGYEGREVVAYKNVPELMDLIEPWSLRKEKETCLDLPEKTYQDRAVTMTPEQTRIYKELKKNLAVEILSAGGEKHRVEVEMVLEAYMRLQQITGGFYSVLESEKVDPISGKKKRTFQVFPIPGKNPKLEELVELISGELKGKQVMVWSRFRAEVALISDRLTKAGLKVLQFHGGMREDEKNFAVSEFQARRADVLVATEQSASYGLTLTAAHTAIYFSMGFSLEEFLQSQDRIHRIGQYTACTYILLACAGTVDSNVNKVLMEKKSIADYVNDCLKGGQGILGLTDD